LILVFKIILPTFEERSKLWSANCHNLTVTQIQNTSSAPTSLTSWYLKSTYYFIFVFHW